MTEDLAPALRPTELIESDHPGVLEFAREHVEGAGDDRDRAIRLYYAVRDAIRYDPYAAMLTVEGTRASNTLLAGRGWCVTKAALLTACCRSQGIPARVGYADVRNHLSTENMRKQMESDVFYWHGYSSIFLDGAWIKATPAFNLSLCEKFDLIPLEFDGREDSIFHPFDASGNRHMEYLTERGDFDDVPLDAILETFREHYTSFGLPDEGLAGDFDAEVERETAP